MIKNIHRLKNFGIFKDCNNAGVNDFGKFNLIFGWNGSGKSTLSVLFESLEKKALPDPVKFPTPEFVVNRESGMAISNNNVSDSDLNICTFNENFVKENIDWDNSVKSILLVAKGNIEERKRLSKLSDQQRKDEEWYTRETDEIAKAKKDVSDFYSESAKRIKTALQVIGTDDSRYMNYNKTKLETFIRQNESDVKSELSIQDDDQLVQLTSAAKPNHKSELRADLVLLDSEIYKKAKQRLDLLLSEGVASKSIDRLKNNSDIQTWVSAGLDIHAKHQSKNCEFCQNEIAEARLNELESHFSDEYTKHKEQLSKANTWLERQFINIDTIPAVSGLYEEYKKDYETAGQELQRTSKVLNNEISDWHDALTRKLENPFDTSVTVTPLSQSSINTCNEAITRLLDIINRHNKKSDNFVEETAKSKTKLELHYAASEVKSFDLYSKIDAIATKEAAKAKFWKGICARKIEIRQLEALLSNESLGAEQFNRSLHKFIGRSDISLRFDKGIMGYEIIRNDSGSHDGNLSEGEKTALAFVYFITKLAERGNELKDTIVVIDDPVSSFDSNHIFHAYSFLRNNCSDAKQLIVMTHNFTFFKLIRDWFNGTNVNRKNRKNPKPENAFFYVIETSADLPRRSALENADSTLIEYDSEYHYLFSKLYKFNGKERLARDDVFLTANISRKLLESFFSFKYPRHRSDLGQLMECGLKNCVATTPDTKEKIYRFINKYSHSDVIEVNEDAAENLFGESHSVISDIFDWIKEVDEVHFNEMVKVVSK